MQYEQDMVMTPKFHRTMAFCIFHRYVCCHF